jgi:inorganic pyrophosphatase
MNRQNVSPLSRLPAFNKHDDCLRAVIETPKGSSNKYDYDPEYGCFALAKTLPEGLAFPFDFGFIPSTRGEDGDPLDILVLMDFPAVTGCVVNARLIGCIRAKQKEKGEAAIRNDRFIAISRDSRTLSHVSSLADLRPGLMDEIKEFFIQYNKLAGKKFKPLGDCGAKEALALVKAGMRKAGKKRP